MQGVAVDTSGAGRHVPSLVIGAGLDDVIHPNEARRTADLLGATYEYFPSATHFGLVMGEHTWPEVAAERPRLARGAPPRDDGRRGRLRRPVGARR